MSSRQWQEHAPEGCTAVRIAATGRAPIRLDRTAVEALAAFIKASTTLASVALERCRLPPDSGIEPITEALTANASAQSLRLDFCGLCERDGVALAAIQGLHQGHRELEDAHEALSRSQQEIDTRLAALEERLANR